MKKVLLIILLFIFLIFPYNSNAKTLRNYIDEMNSMLDKLENYETEREEARKRAAEYQNQIAEMFENVKTYSTEVQKCRERIEELNVEIKEKKEEIAGLMSFFQVSNGVSAYLEYIFGSKSFTDFIERTAIVEELAKHNDELINEMYNLIEENKRQQKELDIKIKEEKKAIEEQKRLLNSINVKIEDLSNLYIDVEAQVAAIKEEIAYLESKGCEMDEDLATCLGVPFATEFHRPLKSGVITSEFGYRTDPYVSFHSGIDIGVPDWTPVYASTAGTVSMIVKEASCGGNKLYIKHNVGGEKFTTRYLHLSKINVSLGDNVNINTIVGYSGGGWTSSGRGGYDNCTTGSHLHFEINLGWSGYGEDGLTAVNPRNYIYFPYRW